MSDMGHNLIPATTTKKYYLIRKLELGLCCELGQRDEMSNVKKNRDRKTHTDTSERENALMCECKRWLLSRCSCDGQIRDSGEEAAPKSRSIIHRDRSSHCRKLWKQNILNGLSHPIHKRQLTVTHTPTHNNDHTDAISFQKGKSRIKNHAWYSDIYLQYDLFSVALQVLYKLITQCYGNTWLVKNRWSQATDILHALPSCLYNK